MPDLELNATLIDRTDLTDELAIFKIRPDSGQIQPFTPGQFATIGLSPWHDPMQGTVQADEWANRDPDKRVPKMIRRAYSIASSPNETEHVELYIVLVSEGKLTPRLWTLKPGDKLYMDDRIKGDFSLDPVPQGKNLILVSTGTGLAPYISMLRTYRGSDRWKKMVIVHGARYGVDLSYKQELEQVAAEDPSVIYIPSTTRDESFDGYRGRVTTMFSDSRLEQMTGVPFDPQQTHIFLCGNPDMINDIEAMMTERGYTTATKKQEGQLHFERYW
jgi:ferredoxin--NADP+ reductase